MFKLVLLRHGESNWNRDNLFTGWTDVDLSRTRIKQVNKYYLGEDKKVKKAIGLIRKQHLNIEGIKNNV